MYYGGNKFNGKKKGKKYIKKKKKNPVIQKPKQELCFKNSFLEKRFSEKGDVLFKKICKCYIYKKDIKDIVEKEIAPFLYVITKYDSKSDDLTYDKYYNYILKNNCISADTFESALERFKHSRECGKEEIDISDSMKLDIFDIVTEIIKNSCSIYVEQQSKIEKTCCVKDFADVVFSVFSKYNISKGYIE